LIHSAARLPSLFHRSLGSSASSLYFHIFLSTFQRISVDIHLSRRRLAKPFGVALCVGGSFISIFDLPSSIF
jgi:hypothetical protein